MSGKASGQRCYLRRCYIEHRWYKDEVLVHTIELPIKSLNWRTQSYKTILPTMAGKWKVDVVLMPGEEVMTSLSFTAK